MITIKKILICSIFAIAFVFFNNTYISVIAYNTDIFDVVKFYAENSLIESEHSTVVLDEGLSVEDAINDKVTEKYLIAMANKANEDNSINNSDRDDTGHSIEDDSMESGSGFVSIDKYPNQDSYFAGTTNFTNLSVSKKDATLNSWSAIRSSYDVYDDGGEDNITIIATAYTSAAEENGGYAGMNAIGGSLGAGCIAAPKDIPFQTKIRISGLGVFNVEDRGGAIVRVNEDTIRVDVWMNSYREAMKFGKRVYKGRIITK